MENFKKIVRKNQKGQYTVRIKVRFTNHRLVRQGGQAYIDTKRDTFTFRTQRQAVEFITDLVNRGATIIDGDTVYRDRVGQ